MPDTQLVQEPGQAVSRSLYQTLWPYAVLALLCTVVLATWSVVRTGQAYSQAHENAVGVQQLATILASANALSAERRPATLLLTAEPDRYAAALATWRRAQTKTDAILDNLMATESVPPELIQQVSAQLARARQGVLKASQTPPDQRSYITVRSALDAMFQAWDRVRLIVLWQSRKMIILDPAIASVAVRNMTLGSLREYAGRLGSYLIVPLMMKQDISATNRIDSREAMAQIQLLWELLPAYGGDVGGSADKNQALSQSYDAARKAYMDQGLALAERLLGSSSDTAQPRMDVATFMTQYVAAVTPLETLRDQNLVSAVDKFNGRQEIALAELATTSLIAILLVGSMAALLLLVRRRVVQPMLYGARVIISLSHDKLPAQRMPRQDQVREIRRLYAAIDAVTAKLAEWSRLTRQFKQLAITDGLTGLINRRNLDELGLKASQSVRSSDVPHVILVDIDHFKAINDHYGHPVGDQVLRELATLMRQTVRENDCVARFGGEEFAIMIQGNSLAEAAIVGRKLRRAVQNESIVTSEGHILKITASFGVAGGRNQAWEDIIRHADEALYRAKAGGRNRVCVTRPPGWQRHAPETVSLPAPEAG